MSQARFFSNTLIYVDLTENEVMSSLANTRLNVQDVFQVPEHTVDTNNLMIFVDGHIKIRDVDYEDINSFEVRFFSPLAITQEFHSILTKNRTGDSTDDGCYWEDF